MGIGEIYGGLMGRYNSMLSRAMMRPDMTTRRRKSPLDISSSGILGDITAERWAKEDLNRSLLDQETSAMEERMQLADKYGLSGGEKAGNPTGRRSPLEQASSGLVGPEYGIDGKLTNPGASVSLTPSGGTKIGDTVYGGSTSALEMGGKLENQFDALAANKSDSDIQNLQNGGMVRGRKTAKVDDKQVLADEGEFMLPVKAVNKLEKTIGKGGLESLRRGELPLDSIRGPQKLASGGYVIDDGEWNAAEQARSGARNTLNEESYRRADRLNAAGAGKATMNWDTPKSAPVTQSPKKINLKGVSDLGGEISTPRPGTFGNPIKGLDGTATSRAGGRISALRGTVGPIPFEDFLAPGAQKFLEPIRWRGLDGVAEASIPPQKPEDNPFTTAGAKARAAARRGDKPVQPVIPAPGSPSALTEAPQPDGNQNTAFNPKDFGGYTPDEYSGDKLRSKLDDPALARNPYGFRMDNRYGGKDRFTVMRGDKGELSFTGGQESRLDSPEIRMANRRENILANMPAGLASHVETDPYAAAEYKSRLEEAAKIDQHTRLKELADAGYDVSPSGEVKKRQKFVLEDFDTGRVDAFGNPVIMKRAIDINTGELAGNGGMQNPNDTSVSREDFNARMKSKGIKPTDEAYNKYISSLRRG